MVETIPDAPKEFKIRRTSKGRRRSCRELCKIRDNDERDRRRTSVQPDQSFIVEEGLLEDLCELAGEEANTGGNIIMYVQ